MAATGRGYLRYPSIQGDRIVFACEDDLWTVGVEGGPASRLTAGLGEAAWPRFSPDGELIAFLGHEDGPADVYVLPAAGGLARRLTFHARPRHVAAWTPDGAAVVFPSSQGRPHPFDFWLHEVPAGGGLPRRLSLGPASAIAHGRGRALLLGRSSRDDPAHWKRYRGGGAGTIWLDPAGEGRFRRLLDLRANLSSPGWLGDRVCFLSDHEGCGNVYSCTVEGEDLRRHTHHDDFYARNLSGDGGRLVYQAGGDLYLLEGAGEQPRRLEVRTASSRTQRRRRVVEAGRYLESAAPSADGARVAITARGAAFTLGVREGAPIQLGERDGVRHRLLTWLPGGGLVAVASGAGDRDGERLVVLDEDGACRSLDLGIGRALALAPAPAGHLVALANHRSELLLVDVREAALRTLDRSPHGPVRGLAWSPDGRWLAYGMHDTRETCAIKLCQVHTGATHQVTRPVLWDHQPAFDPGGRYLYFIGREWRDPVYDEIHYDLDLPRASRPQAICLRAGAPSPFEAVVAGPAAAGTEIDLEGIEERVLAFPVPARRYRRVLGVEGGVVFISSPVYGTPLRRFRDHGAPPGTLERYDLARGRLDALAENVADVWSAPDGRTLLYRSGERLCLVGSGMDWIDLDRVRVPVDPGDEWRQMFREAWRLQREGAWSEELCGAGWDAAYLRYAPLVERIATRSELSDVLGELHGELGSSHVWEFGGDHRRPPVQAQGFLGVDWEPDPETGAYRIAGIVRGDPWDPAATSPLRRPGLDVRPGDRVLAIDGRALDARTAPPELLVGRAGREVALVVQRPGAEPRVVTVRTQADERPGRYRDWVAARRRFVHEASAGRVGYVHLPDQWSAGFAVFQRDYLTEYDRDALVVDVRGNAGGHLSIAVLDRLARRRFAHGVVRWGEPQPFPPHSPAGPLVCLTDGTAGSDGEVLSQGFRLLGLGPLVGTRTWGGATGVSFMADHWLADGTVTTQPQVMYVFDDVGRAMENHGAEVDVEVEILPQDAACGADPQLERAVEVAQERLRHHQPHRAPIDPLRRAT